MKVKLLSLPQNNISNIAKRIKTKIKLSKTLPIVATPVAFYYIGQQSDEYANEILKFMQNKNIQMPLGMKPDPSDNSGFSSGTQINIRQSLENAYKQGKITEAEYKTYDRKVAFTGRDHGNLDTPDIDNIPDAELAESAEISELDEAIGSLTDELGDDSAEVLSELADALDNPLVLGVAAELMPATRFFKPVEDLLDGDTEKAVVGAATRATEMLLGPVKLLGGLGAGLGSAIAGLCGAEDGGFFNGFKMFSKGWAELRDNAENKILGRETKEETRKRKLREKNQLIEEREQKIEALKQFKQELIQQRREAAERERILQEEIRRQEEEERIREEEIKEQECEGVGQNVSEPTALFRPKPVRSKRQLQVDLMRERDLRRQEEARRKREEKLHKKEPVSAESYLLENTRIRDREPVLNITPENLPYIINFVQILKRIEIYSKLNPNFNIEAFCSEFESFEKDDLSIENFQKIRKKLDNMIAEAKN